VKFGVKTAAGQQDMSIQLFERSLPGMDEVIAGGLAAAHATQVDNQVINGSDASGQVEGIRLSDGINSVTYTDADPTAGELLAKIADGVQRIHSLRFQAPTVIAMHPRRWGFFLAARDTTGRPVVDPFAPMNVAARFDRVASENVVGAIQGLPVLVDSSIPTNLGAATKRGPGVRASDAGPLTVRKLPPDAGAARRPVGNASGESPDLLIPGLHGGTVPAVRLDHLGDGPRFARVQLT
jgi:HK97 family phage major capsid protein